MTAATPVPGLWVCPVCKFELRPCVLDVRTGVAHPDERLQRHVCPEDGSTLVQQVAHPPEEE